MLMAAALSCGPSAKEDAKREAPKPPPEPVTGLTGIFRCYQATRSWATDLQILRAQNLHINGMAAPAGKAYAWRTEFVSPSKKRSKTCTFSVVAADGVMEGIFNAGEDSYNGPTKIAQPFIIQAVKKDTDAIWEEASANSQGYAKKNPDAPITFLLEFTDRNPVVAWRVLWGLSPSSSPYSVFVDATRGTFLKKAF